jgi:pantothenate kinase type III
VSTDQLFAEAILGRDAEEFVQSDIGKYVIGCAEQEAQEAMQQLKNVYPWRRRKITELQNKIWRAESLQQWLSELIIQGTQATQQLEED